MFGKKVQVSLELSEPILREIETLLKENNLNLDQAVNLFLYSSVSDERLTYNHELAKDYYTNIEKNARDFLFKELKVGRESFSGPEIKQDQVLMFLGLY